MRTQLEPRTGRSGALQLLKQLRQGGIQPSEIRTAERRVCVAYLRLEGYTQEEMAEIFGVHRQTIVRDEKANRQQAARLVDELDARSVAGGLIGWARHLAAKAVKDKDHALAWRIQRELVHDLQALGYLPKAADVHDVRVSTFADLAALATQGSVLSPDDHDSPAAELPAPPEAEDED